MVSENDIIQAEEAVFESLENCWRAMAKRSTDDPSEELRTAMNLLSKILGTVKAETRERRNTANKTVSVEEWIAWFQEA